MPYAGNNYKMIARMRQKHEPKIEENEHKKLCSADAIAFAKNVLFFPRLPDAHKIFVRRENDETDDEAN